ncbi:MAG: MBL fold metallo-hydrolase [Oscillospiraceae bacterium]|nr:MBL fold metallo-hydrolase [Oscillospiraceae bacterium]
MPKFYSLFSSSKGNCAYLENEYGGILIDASPSFKAIEEAFISRGLNPENIKGVIITHEHSDHVGALKTLSKKLNIPIYASKKVLNFLVNKDFINPESSVFEIEENKNIEISGFDISPFKTPHDALESFGFVINSENASLGFATDLGYMPLEILNKLKTCNTLYIESNYDENMLLCGKYNKLLKMRIMSDHGHLSNYDCSLALKALVPEGVRRVILAHLSEENNTPSLAKAEALNSLDQIGAKEGSDYTLSVSSRQGIINPILF